MEPQEYEKMVQKAEQSKTPQDMIDLLQFMRTHKVSQPEHVLMYGGALLHGNSRRLGGELWTVMEQVCQAACVAGHDDWRDYCIKQLMKQWPNSHRVKRLEGLVMESRGNYTEADNKYKEILKDKPEDTITRKRQICMHKEKGNLTEAIEAIVKYLDEFSTDVEVWHELAELYLEAGSISRATYCFEELFLANPKSLYHILSYAECLYSSPAPGTSQGPPDYELARKYFSLAAYLDGTCLRALWGLLSVGMALLEKDKQQERGNMIALTLKTQGKLKTVYNKLPKTKHSEVTVTMLTQFGESIKAIKDSVK